MVGRKLGRYRILEKLGAGGMGEVWRARDESLDRDVALKMLPAATAADPERRHRFEREAKAVAGLQHPNIVTLHSIEEAGGEYFLTMELVRGRTLGRLLPADGLPLERFFELGVPLADAVHAAHEQGVIHRDLKPGNVMVDETGRLRVLDFGLAKLVAPGEGGGDGKTVAGGDSTQQGQILGTVAYMSPEQAEGKPLDRRSDIFSLGVVLYEMATGKRPFGGDTPISTMSAILRETPPSVTSLKPLPRHLGRIIQRCLEKSPDKRFQTARDVCNELEGLKREVESGEVEPASGTSASSLGLPPAAAPPKRSPWPWLAGAAILAAAIAVVAVMQSRRSAPVAPISVTTRPLTGAAGVEYAGSFSPDGAFFCYSHSANGPLDVFVQSTTGGDPIRLVQSPADDWAAGWSPDNRWIAFLSNRDGKSAVYLIPPLGGTIRKVADLGVGPLADEAAYSMSQAPWSPDGQRLAYVPLRNGELAVWIHDVASGEETQLTRPGKDRRDGRPAWSFDGKRIAFLRQAGGRLSLWVVPADGGEERQVHADPNLGEGLAWSPDSQALVFASGAEEGGPKSLWRVDLDTGAIRQVTAGTTGLGDFSVGRDGRILYGDFSHQTDLYLQAVDGREERRLTYHTKSNFGAQVSPKGDRVAYNSDRTGAGEVWVLDLGTGKEQRITENDAEDWEPTWSPDGSRIAFVSTRSGTAKLWIAPADGGPARELSRPESPSLPRWAPDGAGIGFLAVAEGGIALWISDPDGGAEPRVVLEGVREYDWWRDSRHVIYTASSGNEIRARAVETGRESVLVDEPNTEIAVALDGSALSYCAAESHFNMNLRLLRLEVGEDGLPRAAGPPEAITAGEGKWHVHNGGWTPDGRSVVYTRDTDTGDLFLLEGAF